MNCVYCQQKMKNLFPDESYKRISTVWQCKNCPREVRVIENFQSAGTINRISIFIFHHGKEYCLHWRSDTSQLHVLDTTKDSADHIVDGPKNYLPNIITPQNALQKLLTFLTFS
jgi:hypothetical protein